MANLSYDGKKPKISSRNIGKITENQQKLFLCRSGARSRSAAEFLTAQGFNKCYNCSEGFEGTHNDLGQRSKVNGWKFSGLPWKQG